MSNEKIVQLDAKKVDELAKLPETHIIKCPAYEALGEPLLDKDGAHIIYEVHLTKPGYDDGKALDSFRRGVLSKKGKLKEIPPAQEVITRAVRLCLPNAASKSNEEIKNILIQCGGFNGPQAKLARACMRLCGQTHEADFIDHDATDDDDLPDIIAGVGEQVKPGMVEEDLPT